MNKYIYISLMLQVSDTNLGRDPGTLGAEQSLFGRMNRHHGILEIRQCVPHYIILLRVRSWRSLC